MKNIIFLFFLLMSSFYGFGQQEIILTKYTFNPLFFNPGFAGSTGENQGSATLQYRNQWLGVEGAPTTMLAAAEYSLFDHKLGLGLTIGREQIGVNTNTEVSLSSTYRIQLGEGHLSAGIRTGFSSINSDFTKLAIKESGDVFDRGSERISLFSVGMGIVYHQETMSLGFSMPTFVSIGDGTISRVRHVYSHFQVKIGDEYSSIHWQPNMLIKYQKSVPLQLTLGLQAWFKDRFAPGIHYRVGESIAVSFEMKISESFGMTAAYDFTANDLNDYSSGSMELMLNYIFKSE